MYIGPAEGEGGEGVCAEAGLAEMASANAKVMIVRHLCIGKCDLIPNVEIFKPVWVDFEHVFCGEFRDIYWTPCFCSNFIHYCAFTVKPNNSQIGKDGQHVDGSVEAANMFLDKEQTLIQCDMRTES